MSGTLMASVYTSATAAPGQVQYTSPGTFSWVAPAGVTSVCVVCVGGGVGLLGQGANGAGGTYNTSPGGKGGSGGSDAANPAGNNTPGALYGGGASSSNFGGGFGANGAVRIIWGPGRSYPTNAA